MAQKSRLDDVAATQLHNRLAKQIASQIVNEPIAAGETPSDVMMLCESVLVGVIFGCFQLGSDAKAFDLIVTRVKERLAKIRLEDLEPKGSGGTRWAPSSNPRGGLAALKNNTREWPLSRLIPHYTGLWLTHSPRRASVSWLAWAAPSRQLRARR